MKVTIVRKAINKNITNKILSNTNKLLSIKSYKKKLKNNILLKLSISIRYYVYWWQIKISINYIKLIYTCKLR